MADVGFPRAGDLGTGNLGTGDLGTRGLGGGLDKLVAPRSIALVGASDRAGSFGQRTQTNLARFTGDLYLVNPKREEIDGVLCYPTVADLPVAPDCVIIATPRETVEPVLDQCIARGAGAAVIFASGFSEVGRPELVALQERIAAKARTGGLRIAGPNTIGHINYGIGAGLTFMDGIYLDLGIDAAPETRSIGLVSQSGALGIGITQAMQIGHFFSHALTCGNSCDVDIADCIAYLARDPAAKVIAVNFEGHADPRRVEAACKIASDADKPVVVFKMATGESGAVAAASHTGSLAGAHETYRSMFEHAGAVMVDEYEALLETAAFFAKARPNQGAGVAVVTGSGGAGIMAADAAEAHGVALPQPAPDLLERLKARLPEFGATANPCDVTAQVLNDMGSLIECADGFLERSEYGALVNFHLFSNDVALRRIPIFDELGGKHGKMICTIWLSPWPEAPGSRELIAAPNTALFRSTDRCFAAFAAWRRWLARGDLTATADAAAPAGSRAAAAALLKAADGTVLGERAAKPVLAAYGIETVGGAPASSAGDARAAADEIGYPVAMKLDADGLAHKTEAGGVALNLGDGDEVAAAFTAMMASAKAAAPEAVIHGVLIQRMAEKGVEIVIGGKADPVFGPVVVVGIGGTLVEVLRDTVAAPAPVTGAQALRMLDRLRLSDMLNGVRDLPAVDRAALAQAVARVSDLLADFPDLIAELDVNPVICRGAEILAVDGLIVTRSKE